MLLQSFERVVSDWKHPAESNCSPPSIFPIGHYGSCPNTTGHMKSGQSSLSRLYNEACIQEHSTLQVAYTPAQHEMNVKLAVFAFALATISYVNALDNNRAAMDKEHYFAHEHDHDHVHDNDNDNEQDHDNEHFADFADHEFDFDFDEEPAPPTEGGPAEGGK